MYLIRLVHVVRGRSGGPLGLSVSGKGEPPGSASVPGRILLCVFNGRELGHLFVLPLPELFTFEKRRTQEAMS